MVMVKSPEEKKPGDSASLKAETAPAIQEPGRPADAQDTIGENQDFEDVEALLQGHVPKSPPPSAKTAVREKSARFAEGAPAVAGNGSANGKVAPHSATDAEVQ